MKQPSIPIFFWSQAAFIFFLANVVIGKSIQLQLVAQSCMTAAQVQSDSRCLYIYGHNVYEKGSRNNPHKGNTCGSDVSTKLPGSHNRNVARYMDPNLVGSICTDAAPSPTAAATATATPRPTNPPTAVPTATATATPRPTATAILTPIATAMATATRTPTTAQTATPSPTRTAQATAMATATVTATTKPAGSAATKTATPTPAKKSIMISPTASPRGLIAQTSQEPTPMPSASTDSIGQTEPLAAKPGFGGLLQGGWAAPVPTNDQGFSLAELLRPKPSTFAFLSSYIWWSQILTVASFITLIASMVASYLRPVRSGR